MGKRIVFGSLVVVLLLLLSSAAAYAAPGGNTADAPGHAKHDAVGPSDHGNSKALENASRGMNRVGGPGKWKEHGHVPAPVSDPQGHAPSDPDFTGNGGIDKPGQSGGFSADRDGNNGCGNDDDREDDNNGWCGKRPKPKPPTVTPPTQPPVTPPGRGPAVLPAPKITRPVIEGERLPRTGFDLIQFTYAGWSLIVAGHVLRRRKR